VDVFHPKNCAIWSRAAEKIWSNHYIYFKPIGGGQYKIMITEVHKKSQKLMNKRLTEVTQMT
jgi:hypothetical protein